MKDIYWFSDVCKEDVGIVGGKAANLGEMTRANIPVPKGFVVSAGAYFSFLRENNLEKQLRNILRSLDTNNPRQLEDEAKKIQKLIGTGKMSQSLAKEVKDAYHKLTRGFVAVRSSATAEDLPNASFAGQQATFLNIKGDDKLLAAVQQCWASLFEARAIFYRQEQHFDHMKVGIAVVVQEMVQSDTSGVMFTLDPVTNDRSKVIIEAVYGLGELIVSGQVNPDHYEVDKKSLDINNKEIGNQQEMLVWHNGQNKREKVSERDAAKQKINDSTIKELAKLGLGLEKHYFFPQDIEWAVSGGKVSIVQTRAVTTAGDQNSGNADRPSQGKPFLRQGRQGKQEIALSTFLTEQPIVVGVGASFGVATGTVRIVKNPQELDKIKPGDVLVAQMTSPDYVPAMKRAVAVVTDRGGRSSHAAIVSRELGIPAAVGTNTATKVLKDGMVVTVDGASGKVYKGGLARGQKVVIEPTPTHIDKLAQKTATKLYVNLASPERAHEIAKANVDGVGLLRAEFMLAGIGVHPKKLIQEHKEQVFVNNLAAGLKVFCEAFHPRPVVYRATDFKSNEYRHLVGGELYEPQEENPMLGYRGAFRYVSDPEVFNLELAAVKEVRNKYGLHNLWLMIPFVRTPSELSRVKQLVLAANLAQNATFKLWMMVEIPSNVILLEQFLAVGLDGVSIGSNDLTQLILGVDRDSETLANKFDERDPAVLWALEQVVKICNREKVTVSICGQAPSVYPEIVQKLVEWGVTSISVAPDSIDSVRQTIYDQEKRLAQKKA